MESLISAQRQVVSDKLRKEENLPSGVRGEAMKMQERLKDINTVLASAENKVSMEEVSVAEYVDMKEWMSVLKDVAYDIEDVLEDWSLFQLQRQDKSGTSQRGNMPKEEDQVCLSWIATPSFCIKRGRHEIAHTILEINKRLDEIAERKKTFMFEKNYLNREVIVEPEPSTPYNLIHELPSQEEAKSTLIQKLLNDDFENVAASNHNLSIVSIVGMGGIGKTTLAQLVYNDQIVQNRFGIRIWVCVSKNFNEMRIAKGIARSLGLDVTDLPDLNIVLTKIVDSIKHHTFLLVLDDVWESSEEKWGAILSYMEKGNAKGSKILMTTPSLYIARKMGSSFTFHVRALSEEASWSLFSNYAFFHSEEIRCRVDDIAKELVKKCYGLPLALIVLGKQMKRRTTRSEWRDALSSKILQEEFKDNVFLTFVQSYIELPSTVRRCFTYCSIFLKDTVMKKDRIIQLWMAQGYLQGSNTDHMEVIGEEYFEDLVRKSFIQVKDHLYINAADIAVTMHGLIHDFAQYTSNGEFVIFDPSLQLNEVTVRKPRHLAFSGEIDKSIYLYPSLDFKALRTLFLSIYSINILKELCSSKSYIRALEVHNLPFSDQDTLCNYDLNDVRKLVYLRYLRIELSYLTMLPEGICDLQFLQTLDLEGCHHLKRLPSRIGKVTALRHLLFSREGKIDTFPKGLGKLISLQSLSYFSPSSLNSEDDCNLEDLMGLNNLRGDLWLKNLDRVARVNEATGATLQGKKHVRRLTLEFGGGDASLQSDVLEALESVIECMEFLHICGYRGRRCPQWIGQLLNLKEVQLKDVSIDSLPELGKLHYLETLCVNGAIEVKHLGVEFFGTCTGEDEVFFPNLTSLEFKNMPQWEHWKGPKEIPSSRITIMPSLRRLILMECRLRALPRFLEYVPLERLEARCRLPLAEPMEDEYAKRWRIGDVLLPKTLKEIEISWIESEKEAPFNQPAAGVSKEVQQQHLKFKLSGMDVFLHLCRSVPIWILDLTHIRDIKLTAVKDKCLSPFGLMPFLDTLTVYNAYNVEKVGNEFLGIPNDKDGAGASTTPVAFPSLKVLCFSWMPKWKEWEDPVHRNGLTIMPSLGHLTIYGCAQLKCLPRLLEAVPLKKLELEVSVPWVGRGDTPKIRNTTAESGLREHPLYKCRTASLAALEVFPFLEIFKIKSNLYIRRLGKELALISSLKELYIESMHYLEELEEPWSPQQESSSSVSIELSRHGKNKSSTVLNYMPYLRILSLRDCPKLKALPGFLKGIPLEDLSIHNCSGLETWWENEAGKDWRHWTSNIPRFILTGLSSKGDGTRGI